MASVLFRWFAPPLTFLVILLVWHFGVTLFHVQPMVLPSPGSVVMAFAEAPRWFLVEGLYTLPPPWPASPSPSWWEFSSQY